MINESKEKYFFNTKEKFVQFKINNKLSELVNSVGKDYERIAVVCIGTDRSTGDSYGPLVGHNLSKYTIYDFDVYGTIYEPVHALNLEETLQGIDHENTLVIGVDASLGNYDHAGYICMGLGGLKPGSGVGKDIPPVGDIHIAGIVNISGFMPAQLLQCTRLAVVYEMAEMTTRAISSMLHNKYYRKEKAAL